MGSFRLEPDPVPGEGARPAHGPEGLTSAVLLHNARWFTRIRWIVVAVLTVFGAAAVSAPAWFGRCGLRPPGAWPLVLAIWLALLNGVSIRWVRRLSGRATWRAIAANLWFQVVSDLLTLTVLVYRAGPIDTVIAFAYLFHITLACIFFGRRDSFAVTALSAALFLGAVSMDAMAVLPRASILALGPQAPRSLLHAGLFAVPTVFVWLVVWYLVSALSDAVRQRDRELEAANRRILRADEDMNLQMLRVTHDLKAPFSGIESNIQVLKEAYWDETPESVRAVIEKIDARSAALRGRIGDILTLGSLRSEQAGERAAETVKLRDLLHGVIRDIHGLAVGKSISVNLAAGDATVVNDVRQLKILFSNLISNAVAYSRDGGEVAVRVVDEAARVRVSIADRGIGISDQALPRLFEDFYRTQEAASFNPNSTGLGLAIVRQVARNLRLTIAVESAQGKGAVFEVFFPRE